MEGGHEPDFRCMNKCIKKETERIKKKAENIMTGEIPCEHDMPECEPLLAICPPLPGLDTPVCLEGKCVCGADWQREFLRVSGEDARDECKEQCDIFFGRERDMCIEICLMEKGFGPMGPHGPGMPPFPPEFKPPIPMPPEGKFHGECEECKAIEARLRRCNEKCEDQERTYRDACDARCREKSDEAVRYCKECREENEKRHTVCIDRLKDIENGIEAHKHAITEKCENLPEEAMKGCIEENRQAMEELEEHRKRTAEECKRIKEEIDKCGDCDEIGRETYDRCYEECITPHKEEMDACRARCDEIKDDLKKCQRMKCREMEMVKDYFECAEKRCGKMMKDFFECTGRCVNHEDIPGCIERKCGRIKKTTWECLESCGIDDPERILEGGYPMAEHHGFVPPQGGIPAVPHGVVCEECRDLEEDSLRCMKKCGERKREIEKECKLKYGDISIEEVEKCIRENYRDAVEACEKRCKEIREKLDRCLEKCGHAIGIKNCDECRRIEEEAKKCAHACEGSANEEECIKDCDELKRKAEECLRECAGVNIKEPEGPMPHFEVCDECKPIADRLKDCSKECNFEPACIDHHCADIKDELEKCELKCNMGNMPPKECIDCMKLYEEAQKCFQGNMDIEKCKQMMDDARKCQEKCGGYGAGEGPMPPMPMPPDMGGGGGSGPCDRCHEIEKDLRVEIYTFIIKKIREAGYSGPIALCKETMDVWENLIDSGLLSDPGSFGVWENVLCNCKF